MVAKNKFGFDDSIDLTQCLKQIEIHDLFHMCAPYTELPSNISTILLSLSRYKCLKIHIIEITRTNNK